MTDKEKTYHFVLSSFSRLYGVTKLNEKMKEFARQYSNRNAEDIQYRDLNEFDKYINNLFENFVKLDK